MRAEYREIRKKKKNLSSIRSRETLEKRDSGSVEQRKFRNKRFGEHLFVQWQKVWPYERIEKLSLIILGQAVCSWRRGGEATNS